MNMEQRIFHGDFSPQEFAQALISEFDHGNLQAHQFGSGNQIQVQIATDQLARAGGQTALTVTLRRVADGVAVEIGKQAWLGLAASLSQTAFSVLKSPWNLLERLDDVAQDIESLQLSEEVWKIIEQTAKSLGATFELSERLRRLVCAYCQTANPVGEPSCIACGAPLGQVQPRTCPTCGFVVKTGESTCPNCGRQL
jgi:RNA polymerase subunit RPABC4/transcription elongation factor Spt4